MKCVLTGKETKDKTKNYPLSVEGRQLVKNYKQKVVDYSVEKDLPYIVTNKMAIEHLIKGYDLVEDAKSTTENMTVDVVEVEDSDE